MGWNFDNSTHLIICTGFPTSCEVKYDILILKVINNRFKQPCPLQDAYISYSTYTNIHGTTVTEIVIKTNGEEQPSIGVGSYSYYWLQALAGLRRKILGHSSPWSRYINELGTFSSIQNKTKTKTKTKTNVK